MVLRSVVHGVMAWTSVPRIQQKHTHIYKSVKGEAIVPGRSADLTIFSSRYLGLMDASIRDDCTAERAGCETDMSLL